MRIKSWISPEDQMCTFGRHQWSVSRLFELTKSLPVMHVHINHLSLYYTYEKLTLRDMVMHMAAVNDADLSKPIILDEDGELMDGRHRLMKAMLTGQEIILVVRFDTNPAPCRVIEI